MRLFHYRQSETAGEIPGLAAAAAARGWQPVTGRPVSDALAGGVYEIACAMYGVSPSLVGGRMTPDASQARFQDAYRFPDRGRTVTVANARAVMDTEARYLPGPPKEVAVCAVELPTLLPFLSIWPGSYRRTHHHGTTSTGDGAFDQRFAVEALPGFELAEYLTPSARQQIMAHDDWAFQADHTVLCSIAQGASTSVEQLLQRVGDTLAVIEGLPATTATNPAVEGPVPDPAARDLAQRISRLSGPEEVMVFLQTLADDDRATLAASDSPLAPLAQARTIPEAMATLQSLDPTHRMQLLAMFRHS